jgi:hypothetical protein
VSTGCTQLGAALLSRGMEFTDPAFPPSAASLYQKDKDPSTGSPADAVSGDRGGACKYNTIQYKPKIIRMCCVCVCVFSLCVFSVFFSMCFFSSMTRSLLVQIPDFAETRGRSLGGCPICRGDGRMRLVTAVRRSGSSQVCIHTSLL